MVIDLFNFYREHSQNVAYEITCTRLAYCSILFLLRYLEHMFVILPYLNFYTVSWSCKWYLVKSSYYTNKLDKSPIHLTIKLPDLWNSEFYDVCQYSACEYRRVGSCFERWYTKCLKYYKYLFSGYFSALQPKRVTSSKF